MIGLITGTPGTHLFSQFTHISFQYTDINSFISTFLKCKNYFILFHIFQKDWGYHELSDLVQLENPGIGQGYPGTRPVPHNSFSLALSEFNSTKKFNTDGKTNSILNIIQYCCNKYQLCATHVFQF